MLWCGQTNSTDTMTIEIPYRCPDCRFERMLVYGTQWQHVDELHRYRRDIQRGKYGDVAGKWLARYPDAMLVISTALFTCRRCDALQTAERLSLYASGKQVWEMPVRCMSCHAPCHVLDKPPSSLPCTACGKICLRL